MIKRHNVRRTGMERMEKAICWLLTEWVNN